jgi:hypothetical protein
MSAASPALDVVEDRKLRGNEAFKGKFVLVSTSVVWFSLRRS